jgi:hypothetical protein
MSTAVAGETAASMAEAIMGRANVNASISHVMSTSSGSRVRLEGTIATSSKPYARRAALPMPISISATVLLREPTDRTTRTPTRHRVGGGLHG